MTTFARLIASILAIASPNPAVLPVTTAALFSIRAAPRTKDEVSEKKNDLPPKLKIVSDKSNRLTIYGFSLTPGTEETKSNGDCHDCSSFQIISAYCAAMIVCSGRRNGEIPFGERNHHLLAGFVLQLGWI